MRFLTAAAALLFAVGASARAGTSKPVTFFPADTVSLAFSRGEVLVGEGDGRNYMVHASRRVMPGQAEVHERDTDIIYVLEGKATFVTGGTAVDLKMTAPGELRGASIDGGETRVLAKGDVMVVPAGVPHWFKEVDGTFLYYVVKVR